ncbi:hypothetical protein Naga_101748g2, partial [Nannochloropsis gaditana]
MHETERSPRTISLPLAADRALRHMFERPQAFSLFSLRAASPHKTPHGLSPSFLTANTPRRERKRRRQGAQEEKAGRNETSSSTSVCTFVLPSARRPPLPPCALPSLLLLLLLHAASPRASAFPSISSRVRKEDKGSAPRVLNGRGHFFLSLPPFRPSALPPSLPPSRPYRANVRRHPSHSSPAHRPINHPLLLP